MKTITVFNNKGGVGKTTLLCNLAGYLAIKKRKKVLVIDADPQCNATIYSMGEEFIERTYTKSKRETIVAMLEPLRRGRGYLKHNLIPVKTKRFGYEIIAGDPDLSLSEDLLASDWKIASSGDPRGIQTSLVFYEMIQRFTDYDYIFFDIGPSLGAINRAVLLASTNFILPMSSDIFSVMAVRNISSSLKKWKRGVEESLKNHREIEGEPFTVDESEYNWSLQFSGYITQQYTAKSVRGKRQAVSAYEKIIKKMPEIVREELSQVFSGDSSESMLIGEIPNLHSIVPLSQTANCPIFMLKGSDGVVGAHFTKVKDSERIYESISDRLLNTFGEDAHGLAD